MREDKEGEDFQKELEAAESKKKLEAEAEAEEERRAQALAKLEAFKMAEAGKKAKRQEEVKDAEKKIRDEEAGSVQKKMFEEAEKAAFKKLVAKMGMTQDQIEKIAAANKKKIDLPMVDYEVPFMVKINGKRFPLRGRVRSDVAETIVHAAASKRMRLIKEKVSHKNEIFQLTSGQIGSRLVSAEDEAGSPVGHV